MSTLHAETGVPCECTVKARHCEAFPIKCQIANSSDLVVQSLLQLLISAIVVQRQPETTHKRMYGYVPIKFYTIGTGQI